MKIRVAIIVFVIALGAVKVQAQFYSVRTNLLGWATATPNIGFGIDFNRKVSLDLTLNVNPLKTPKFSTSGIALQQGLRFWFLESNIGTFLGVHLTEAVYDVGNAKTTYKGFLGGVGFSVGYSWLLSKRWNVGVELGASVLYMQDTQTPLTVPDTDDAVITHSKRWVIAPTKAEVCFVYLF